VAAPSPFPGFQFAGQALQACLDILFPPRCAGCRKPGSVWCEKCRGAVQARAPHTCASCGARSRHRAGCLAAQARIEMRAFAAYRPPLVGALLQLKYRPNRRLARILAEGPAALSLAEGWSPDLVVAVPLGFRRQQSRGYNQVALVAEQLAELLTTNYDPLALTRIRETRTQVGLNPTQRRRNVADAFAAVLPRVAGRRVLVVDDLTTTGATFAACASALYRAGAEEVFGLSVARPVSKAVAPNAPVEGSGP